MRRAPTAAGMVSVGLAEAGTTSVDIAVALATASAGAIRAETPITRATATIILGRPSAGMAITEAMGTAITAIEAHPALHL